MSAAFVAEGEQWPTAGPFALRLLDVDAVVQIIPNAAGGGEVPIVGPRTDAGRLVVSTALPTIDQARRVARTLEAAFAKVRAIEAEAHDEPADGHEHDFEEFRLSRSTSKTSICVLCGAREEATDA